VSTQLTHVFDGRFEIAVDIPEFVSYLHYDNKLPVIQNLAISATDGKSHSGISLSVVIRSADLEFSEPFIQEFSDITPGRADFDLAIKLLPQLFKAIESNRSAEVVFELFENDLSLGIKSVTTELFPMNLWKRGSGSYFDALLVAAFSQPGDPAVKKILTKAAQIKASFTDPNGQSYKPITSGYQGDEYEVAAEVRAVYEALQTLEIRYSNPLPNFSDFGQPIRTPSEILDTKAATCLDSALLVASCLEAIGLFPVVFTVPKHAFVGVWLKGKPLPSPVAMVDDVAGLLKSEMIFFETTSICDGIQISFADAIERNMYWLDANYVALNDDGTEDPTPKLITDICAARGSEFRIHSLPTVQIGADGAVTVIQTELPKIEFNFTGSVDNPRLSLREDNSPDRVKIWKTSLLDSSFNNPLLNIAKRKASIVQIAVPNGKIGDLEDQLQDRATKFGLVPFWKRVEKGWLPYRTQNTFGPLPEEWDAIASERLAKNRDLSFMLTTQVPHSVVRKLANASASSIQETGVNNLYMTFGSLTWDKDPKSPAAGQVTSPLFLLPVSLKNLGKDNFELTLDDSGEPAPNETLAIALAKVGVNVPLLSNPETDSAGFDIPGLLKHVREQVNVVHKRTNWVVNEDAFIGTFDFSSFHMWKDLHDNWETLAKAPLVKHLIETDGSTGYVDTHASKTEISDDDLDRELARLPIESDAAQVKAILKSLSGESFIIQGPPGTGKSQTITNLLARNLQEGKRVLFMSEKAAALAVVKSRLDSIGLGDFILDLHDKGTKPANIRNQLLASLDAAQDVDRTGLETANGEYDTALRALSTYPARLHTVSEKYGESVYSARDRLLEIPGSEILSFTRKFVTETPRSDYEALLIAFRELPQIGENAKTIATNEWSFARVSTEKLTLEIKDQIKVLVGKLSNLLESATAVSSVKSILAKIGRPEELLAYKTLSSSDLPSASELAIARSPEGAMKRKSLQALLKKFLSAAQAAENYSEKLSTINLSEIQLRLVEASNGGLFKGKKLKNAAEYLSAYVNGDVNKDNVNLVFEAIRPIIETCQKIDELTPSVVGLGSLMNENAYQLEVSAAIQQKLTELEAFLEATDPAANPNGQLLLDAVNAGAGDELGKLGEIGEVITSLFALVEADESSIQTWVGAETFGQKLSDSIEKLKESADEGDLRLLTRWSDVIGIIQPLIRLEQELAVSELLTGKVAYNDAPRALQRGYFKLLFEKLVDEQEIANFEGRSHDSKISQLGDALKKLREYNRGQIASDVLATRKFDASSTAGITGALRLELTKQRRQLPVRKLMKQYWQTITQVTPVVAASPDSVARFLDIDSAKFDLVVFDEASQIRVAGAIGALGRASQAIIVGDTEQMPPTDMFKKSQDDLPEDLVDEEDLFNLNDQESILSMAGVSQIPSTMLTWHYRSNDELLIAFSNKYIYEGKLSSFPSPRIGEGRVEDRKLSLRYDNDLYVQSTKGAKANADAEDEFTNLPSTNLGEAKRVVKEIQDRVKASGTKPVSIGVITMNEQQRALIEKLLDALDDDTIRRARNPEVTGNEQDYLFVRALERVQGDERDLILFSIGFAPTEPKGRLQMSFGPLTRARSERRLNVAVTRARKEMIVFSSFKPEQMTISEVSHKGLKLLQKFLILAAGPSGNDGESGETLSVASNNVRSLRDRHRSDIAGALTEAGYKVIENLGLSNFRVDLAIADPRDESKCILGVMLDGEGWKSRNSSSDREVLPNVVLKNNMKWPGIERIWLPMWLRDREGEIARIKLAVDTILAASDLRQAAEADKVANSASIELDTPVESITGLINIEDLLASAESPLAAPEKAAVKVPKKNELGVSVDEIAHFMSLQDKVMVQDKKLIDYLEHPKVKDLLLYLMDELTKIEGPVSEKRAAIFVAKCFGFSTVQEAKRNYILENIPKKVHARDSEGFIFPKGEKTESFEKWAKQNPGVGRSIADISLVEISNAMAFICGKTAGMSSPELAKQASLAFGITKLTNTADARMVDAERLGVKRGVLVDQDGIIMNPRA
jgi:hypothetical protein